MELSRRQLLAGATLVAGAAACANATQTHPNATASTAAPATTTPPTAAPTKSPRPHRPHVAREIVHGPRTKHAVALTFHGNGDVGLTRQLLHEVELRRLTGSPGRWFRPSGTPHATPLILREAAASGYAQSLSYDVDSLDYTDPGAGAVTQRTLDLVRPGSIVSLHLGHRGTVEAMPAILDGLRHRGLAAVTMSGLVG